MTYIPSSPDAGGPYLAAYIAADPRRNRVFDNINARLGPAGKVEALARYYIVRNAYRREVFRGILIATRCKIPIWARESFASAEANRAFIADYRDAYNAFRKETRGSQAGCSHAG